MKKILIIAAAILSITACTYGEYDPTGGKCVTTGEEVSLNVRVPQSLTRADISVDNNEVIFKWDKDDKLKVTMGLASTEFDLTRGDDSNCAIFTGKMPSNGSVFNLQYPVKEPDLTQQLYAGKDTVPVGMMKFTAYRCKKGQAINLKAESAILKLNLWGSNTVGKIEVTNLTSDKEEKYILECSEGVEVNTTENEATTFLMVIPVGEYKYKVEVYDYYEEEIICKIEPADAQIFTPSRVVNIPAKKVKPSESCLAAGTRITMADGSTKKVENIVEGDIVRTFDHESGCISSAKVCLAMQEEGQKKPLNLHFTSGNTLTIAGQHGLIEQKSRKYVLIHIGNVQQFVGKYFYNAQTATWDKLESYEIGSTPVNRYAIYSARHLNVIAENILTVEDDIDFFLNIYELDASLKADATQLAADKAQYGLCDIAKDFPEFAQYQSQMEDLGCKYIYIAIGKGLVHESYIDSMKAYWIGK